MSYPQGILKGIIPLVYHQCITGNKYPKSSGHRRLVAFAATTFW